MLVKIHCSEEMKCDYDEKKRKNIKEKEKGKMKCRNTKRAPMKKKCIKSNNTTK